MPCGPLKCPYLRHRFPDGSRPGRGRSNVYAWPPSVSRPPSTTSSSQCVPARCAATCPAWTRYRTNPLIAAGPGVAARRAGQHGGPCDRAVEVQPSPPTDLEADRLDRRWPAEGVWHPHPPAVGVQFHPLIVLHRPGPGASCLPDAPVCQTGAQDSTPDRSSSLRQARAHASARLPSWAGRLR